MERYKKNNKTYFRKIVETYTRVKMYLFEILSEFE